MSTLKIVGLLVSLSLFGFLYAIGSGVVAELRRRETFDVSIATSAIPATRVAYQELTREGVIEHMEKFSVYPSRVHVSRRWAALTEARMQELVYSAALESRSRDGSSGVEVVDQSGTIVARYDPARGIRFGP